VYVLVTMYNDLYVLFFINSKEQENAGGVYGISSYVAYSTLCLDNGGVNKNFSILSSDDSTLCVFSFLI